MRNAPVKIIELEDQYVSKANQFPYVLAVKSKIRFRLRSRFCYDHQPMLLLQKLESFDYCLPLKANIDITSEKTKTNFTVLTGLLKKDGAWEVDLPPSQPGVVSFQLAFTKPGSNLTVKFGTHDVILLCQDKYDLRKLRKQTVFPRCIGRCDSWPAYFRGQQAIGYNAFHFAPIQETGASHSYYSLKNHLELSSMLFDGNRQEKNAQLQRILQPLKKQGMVFFIDIVPNHTSFDTEWVKDSPDAVFTYQNTPMLYTAYLVDDVIYQWGEEVKEMMSFDVEFTEDILLQIEENLKTRLIFLKLYQYFQLSPELQKVMLGLLPPSKPSENIFAKDPVQSIEEFLDQQTTTPNQRPFGVLIKDLEVWEKYGLAYEQNDLNLAITSFNKKWRAKIQNQWIPQIIRGTIKSVKYHFLQNSFRSFDDPYPLVDKYFTRVDGTNGQFYAMNNGWVEGNDSRELFILSNEYFYLRRRVNIWGDTIRLRYEKQPSDSPVAWAHMLECVRQMARYFDGFRLDNLHGTPIHVARYLIKQARKVNPNLLVFGELFVNTEAETIEFVKQIGINSTLKEAQHILSGDGFVYHFHNKINVSIPYLGSINRLFIQNGQLVKYAVKKRPVLLVYDYTHDNPSFPSQKRVIFQTPLAFLLSMTGTFIGSTKGFDQFYSQQILVTELKPLYQNDYNYPPIVDRSQIQAFLINYSGKAEKCSLLGSWNDWKEPMVMKLDQTTKTHYTTLFLTPGKYQYKFLAEDKWVLEQNRRQNGTNHLLTVNKIDQPREIHRNIERLRLSTAQKADKFFDFNEYHVWNVGNIVIIFRQPKDHTQSMCAIVNLSATASPLTKEIQLIGDIIDCQVWVPSDLAVYQGQITQTEISFSKNIYQYFDLGRNETTGSDVLKAPFLPAGLSCFIHCRKNKIVRQTITSVEEILARPLILPPMGPLQINGLFFNCQQEQEHLWGQGTYTIPQANNHQMVYAGFSGAFQMVLRAKRATNLNEGLFQNLREGNWLLDYYLNRVRRYKHILPFVEYLQKLFYLMGASPRYLIPKYFSQFIYKLILALRQRFNAKTDFQSTLMLASCQFINYFPNCPLPDKTLFSAGLPHFSIAWARCWGRDTFTSSDILRLHPNIFRQTLLQFASAQRHGLIPNLLDQGNRPRYNCRDACWWFLKAILEYIQATQDYEILKNKVQMIFFSSDKFEHQRKKNTEKKRILLLEQIVADIFQQHASGITYREWNAGYQIDGHMTSEGFNISLQADPDSGFIFGGSPSNCLTWMDKMGSSAHAGTKGVPATPRAGSPVELVGLLYYALTRFQELSEKGYFSSKGIHLFGKFYKFSQWAEKIKQNFEDFYFLQQRQSYEHAYVRGIYKDLVGSPVHYDQQRFRPNALIALAIAPELAKPQNAISFIKKVQKYLLLPKSLGVATLADMHSPYSPFYDNSDDSNDAKIAHGFSYHNGPEWVWLYGFYLTAKINFQREELTKRRMMTLVQQHIKHIQKSDWQSLPELTNRNGQSNYYSCNAQAWSISTILMALRKIQTLPEA